MHGRVEQVDLHGGVPVAEVVVGVVASVHHQVMHGARGQLRGLAGRHHHRHATRAPRWRCSLAAGKPMCRRLQKHVPTSSSESSHDSLTDHSSSLSHRAPGYSRFMSVLLTGGRSVAVPPMAAAVPTALHSRWETVTTCTGLTLDTGAVHRNTQVDVSLSLRGTRLCKIFRFLADTRSVRNRAC